MALLPSAEWRAAEALAGIGYVNPFLPERVELERRRGPALHRGGADHPVPAGRGTGTDLRQRPRRCGSAPSRWRPRWGDGWRRESRRPEESGSSTRTCALPALLPIPGGLRRPRRAVLAAGWVGRSGPFLEGVPLRLRSTLPGGWARPALTPRPEDDPRRLLPDPAGVRPDLRQHHRRIDARGPAAGDGLGIDLHSRHEAIRPVAAPDDGRRSDPHRGSLRQRQGAGRPGHRAVLRHPFRPRPRADSWSARPIPTCR